MASLCSPRSTLDPTTACPVAVQGARLQYIFVGAFRKRVADGSTGGQLLACRTLIESAISDHVSWIPIDSTMRSVPAPPVRKRIAAAGRRLWSFTRALHDPDVAGALIFSSAGLSFMEKGLMALMAQRFGKRVVFSPRSGLILDDIERSPLMRWLVPAVLRRCDVIVCQGQSWKRALGQIASVADHRLAVIPNWLDVGPYAELAQQRRRAHDPAVFLYLGWLERYKGIHDLIDAVAQARDQLPGSRVIVCGSGTQDAAAREKIARLGLEDIIEMRGWVAGEAKNATLLEADVLVLPSHREGMPNALIEAMATGMAVIGTRVGGVPDVIVDDTVGVLLEPGDPRALGQAMVALARDPQRCHRLGIAAQRHARQNHDIANAWPRILHALQGRSDGSHTGPSSGPGRSSS